jgi:hypothetical protein
MTVYIHMGDGYPDVTVDGNADTITIEQEGREPLLLTREGARSLGFVLIGMTDGLKREADDD